MAVQDVEVLPRPFGSHSRIDGSLRRISPVVVDYLVRLSDAIVVLGGAFAAFYILRASSSLEDSDVLAYVAATVLGVAFSLLLLNSFGVYQFAKLPHLRYQVPRITLAWPLAVVLLGGVVYAMEPPLSWDWIVAWWLLAGAGLIQARLVWGHLVRRWLRTGRLAKRVAIYGVGPQASAVFDWLARQNNDQFAFVGVYDDYPSSHEPQSVGLLRGALEDLVSAARGGEIDEVIVALPPAEKLRASLGALRQLSVDVYWPLDLLTGGVEAKGAASLNGRSFLQLVCRPLSERWAVVKWLEDKFLGLFFLAVSVPFMLLIALVIKLESPGPVLFRQPRFGFNNKEIIVYKFRTMYDDQTDISGAVQTKRGDSRVTRFGQVLRRFNLDELPQFINVLQGRLSLVGPRPHPLHMRAEDQRYDEAVAEYAARHRVKPGITGWAQVNGLRGPTETMDKAVRRVDYDLFYIENWSLSFDLRIILLTLLRGFSDPNAF